MKKVIILITIVIILLGYLTLRRYGDYNNHVEQIQQLMNTESSFSYYDPDLKKECTSEIISHLNKYCTRFGLNQNNIFEYIKECRFKIQKDEMHYSRIFDSLYILTLANCDLQQVKKELNQLNKELKAVKRNHERYKENK